MHYIYCTSYWLIINWSIQNLRRYLFAVGPVKVEEHGKADRLEVVEEGGAGHHGQVQADQRVRRLAVAQRAVRVTERYIPEQRSVQYAP